MNLYKMIFIALFCFLHSFSVQATEIDQDPMGCDDNKKNRHLCKLAIKALDCVSRQRECNEPYMAGQLARALLLVGQVNGFAQGLRVERRSKLDGDVARQLSKLTDRIRITGWPFRAYDVDLVIMSRRSTRLLFEAADEIDALIER